ncbi:phosphotransferase [Oceanibacterium hippocampi]|uniref:Putative aminoglycoside phosphotransferase n=1 Tax=Oceanibacterium hippocampi TaxID=745714 RepID=A0A1Y5S7R0_9PROT|nr:phosphotransferase [Oceanibacterium hippocampi]SLN33023.1 Putative aminoglycoside phosphotransferase [Oceanibacterium hippocampi]
MSAADETSAVREAHRLDETALASYLESHLPGYAGRLTVRQFKGGQSNPTYVLETPARRYVLRKKPPGKLLPSAHAVEREYKVIRALAGTGVPVPEALLLCQDESVVGTAFYVMSLVEGRVFRDPRLPDHSPAERAAIYDAMNEVMARLHGVDYAAVGLGDFGKPGNYFARQIGRWGKQYRGAETERIEAMESLLAWLPENIPGDDETRIVHGDFRLENMIFDADEAKVVAVLDWELSTLGHPLADVAYNCLLYHYEHPRQGGLTKIDFATSGIPSEADYLAAYAERTGRDNIEANFGFCLAFSLFRLASITQGVYKRGLDGNASSERALSYGPLARTLAETAWSIVETRCR